MLDQYRKGDLLGGKRESTESAIETLVRETKQEAGIELDDIEYIGEDVWTNHEKSYRTFAHIFSATTNQEPQNYSEEHTGHVLLPKEYLVSPTSDETVTLFTPTMRLDVWPSTERMLRLWQQKLFQEAQVQTQYD